MIKTLLTFLLGGCFFLFLTDVPLYKAKVGMDKKIIEPLKEYVHNASKPEQEKKMKTALFTIGIIFLLGCGKDKNKGQYYSSNKSIEVCSNLTGEDYCSCLNQIAYDACASACNDAEYGNCVKPYLETAYLNYCNIDRRRSSR